MNPPTLHNCLRCSHIWASRLPLPPRWCPRCHSEAWNRARIAKPQVPAKPAPVVHPFTLLEAGQSCLIPWVVDAHGRPDEAANAKIAPRIRAHGRYTGKVFTLEPKAFGLHVWRQR